MTNTENFLSIARRQGYEHIPVDYTMCPSLRERFTKYLSEHDLPFDVHVKSVNIPDLRPVCASKEELRKFHPEFDTFREGTNIDIYGVAHEPGSAAAYHMTKMHHPMKDFDSPEQFNSYPLPDYSSKNGAEEQRKAIDAAHEKDLVAIGNMQCTIWESAWYMRGMENLMMDMMCGEDIADILLDRVTDISLTRAVSYAENGADVLFLGDDIGMQKTPLMSLELYREYLKPRLSKIIKAAKKVKPDIIVFYHSCGFVEPFIPDLIEAGVDVLNPVQPECMSFEKLHSLYSGALSFHGTIGTQTTMPFGTPDEVRKEVFKNLDIAGAAGGLFVAPTHLLEPEVPVENVIAYIKACHDYTR